uniref:DUF4371 domain-containing protein n=1 Tax=Trichuris muris TaxID=70415 RepID=A0A5S6QCA7_TRIMR
MSNDIEETLCGFCGLDHLPCNLTNPLCPELLFAKELVTDTKGESIFRAVEEFFKEKNIPLTNIMTTATDGAPSMVGSHRGFIAHLKKVVPRDENAALRDNLKKFKSDIAYLTELYFKFNEMNLQLQGDDLNLIKTKAIISAFASKLVIFKRNLGRGEFCQFPLLAALKENTKVVGDDILVYCNHLEMLHADFTKRFIDILSMKIPDWVVDPFCDVEETETELQEELLELQNNDELIPKFTG